MTVVTIDRIFNMFQATRWGVGYLILLNSHHNAVRHVFSKKEK